MLHGAFGYIADYVLWFLCLLSLLTHTWCFFRYFPKLRWPKARLILGNSLITLCLIAMVAFAGETYVRFASISTESFGMTIGTRRWLALYTNLNSYQCRDIEWAPQKPEGIRRIAFVGDSFTFGWGIEDEEDRFSSIVAARFQKTVPGRVEVMNAACPGWGTRDQVPAVEHLIDDYGVDEIVLCYLPNDIEKVIPKRPDFDPTRAPRSMIFNTDSSFLIEYLYYHVIVPRKPSVRNYHDGLAEAYADESVWHNQQTLLGQVMTICRDRGVALRVVLLPFPKTGGEKFDTPGIHARLRDFFDANQTEVLDLAPTIAGRNPEELIISAIDTHPNETVHALWAERIWTAFYASPR